MTRALRITMTLYGVGAVLFGLSYLLFPREMSILQGGETATPYLVATKMALGATILVAGGFAAIAAQQPVLRLVWVRFAMTIAAMLFGVSVYSGLVLYSDLWGAAVGLLIHGVFGLAMIVLYPWRRAASEATS